VQVLQEIGKECGYIVNIIQPVQIEGQVVSSSLIRTMISRGEVGEASRFLGRRYLISGQVIHGDGRGHGLGIPTANMDIEDQLLVPASGVYITWAYIEGKKYQSVTSIGYRPTFEDNTTHVTRTEPHLLDFNQNIYGKQLTLEFVEYIRPEIRYPGKEALLEQIQNDILITREVLAHE
jgi:riboflavin kinase/FMN adenylyltransferase